MNPDRIRADVELLSSLGSRAIGSEGSKKAARLIADRLLDLGLREVACQEFPMVSPVDEGFELRPTGALRGAGVKVRGLWPNLVRTSTIAGEGISGRLIYVADGRSFRFDGHDVEGSIVLMDFESGTRWLTSGMLGAKAVIFLDARAAVRQEAEEKYLQKVPLPLPRFYLSRDGLLECARIGGLGFDDVSELLHSLADPEAPAFSVHVGGQMSWVPRLGYNVVAELPGKKAGPCELIVSAYYDSTSIVPSVSPGAEAACGAASLLEMARVWSAEPPDRTVRFLFTSGHFRALAGMRNYVAALAADRRRAMALKEIEESEYGGAGPIFFGLDLSSHSRQVGLFFQGHFYEQIRAVGESKLRKHFYDVSDTVDGIVESLPAEVAPEGCFVSGIRTVKGRDWQSYLNGSYALDAEVYSTWGGQGLSIVTTGDSRTAVGTPADTPDRVDFDGLAVQARFVTSALWAAASHPKLVCQRLGDRFDAYSDLRGKLQGETLIDYLPGRTVIGGIVAYRLNYGKSLGGVRGMDFARSDEDGIFYVPGCAPQDFRHMRWRRIWGFDIDDDTGIITHVNSDWQGNPRAARGRKERRDRHKPFAERETDTRLPLFEGVSTSLYDLVDPLYSRSLLGIETLDARSNSQPRTLMYFLGESSEGSGYSEPVATVFSYRGDPLKFVLTAGDIGKRMVLVNTEAGNPDGTGFATEEPENFVLRTSYQAALDMVRLDGARLKELNNYGIRSRSAEDLHRDAASALAKSQQHLEARRYSDFLDDARGAWALEAKAYPEIRSTISDVVRGLIFYFALVVPFCYFSERLFYCGSDIRARLAFMAAVFLAIYVVLWWVHPAFQISKTPVIILLGFLMVALALIVTYMLIDRFNIQMRFVREHVSAHHSADVARGGAAAVSFALGVSNMRKRPLRTAMTSVTLVLLMFTILSFTSFQSEQKMNASRLTGEPVYQGMIVRKLDWGPIEKFAAYAIANHFRDKGDVSVRKWVISPRRAKRLKLDAYARGSDQVYTAQAVLGLDPQDVSMLETAGEGGLVAGRFLSEEDSELTRLVCLIPKRMADHFGVDLDRLKDADAAPVEIILRGVTLKVVGVFSGQELAKVEDLDGESIFPVDYLLTEERKQEQEKQRQAQASAGTGNVIEVELVQQYEHLDPAEVVIVPGFVADALGASPRSISVKVRTAEQAADLIKEYVPRSMLLLFAGMGEDRVLFSTRGALSVKGLSSMAIPFSIAALMVLNVMLGSVYERLREIHIFSSVGLAPLHVGALFLAESCVYASLGAIFGYLLGQIVAKVVTTYDLLVGITLNYSSTSAVVATFLVALVVVVSTLFPAKKAADYSVPDETRKLKLPKPEGDHWHIPFPFTVSSREALGLNTFLYEFLEAQDEATTGRFCTADVGFSSAEEGTYRIEANVWLTPLDSGISQHVIFVTRPTADEQVISEIDIDMDRLSGEVSAWQRLNPGFIVTMRKQFLIWRLVKAENKNDFRRKGMVLLGLAPPEEEAAGAAPDEGGTALPEVDVDEIAEEAVTAGDTMDEDLDEDDEESEV